MNSSELKELLTELDNDIDMELSEFFNSNQVLYSKFSRIVRLIVLENASFSEDIINRLDILTDNMDSFNYGCVKEDIDELLNVLG